jgi:phosphoribosylglycinamide formyltransferase 1
MNIAVFASGRGSNFQAILNAIQNHVLPAHVCVVISNNSSAGALELALAHGIPALHLSRRQFATEDAFVEQLLGTLKQYNAGLLALAGYMKKLPPRIVQEYRNRILNIHPALLPSHGGPGMYGMHVHTAVLASGAAVSGATVHLVDEEYDRGPIVMQKTVPVKPGDTPELLAERVLAIEHEIYPLALKAFVEGRVRIKGQTVEILGPGTTTNAAPNNHT